ncbi:uncharacterized protein PV06_10490 [Exophiala oligosperma]|uniref:Alpha 1,4-glycosyltransferase domain-containing protein n=1 Tax=Exophiala oligosperma TaxID=215243 RepID=A0A0D2AAT2_9EURO|nr:uncharacterized protein PV06_10490 [Exophiala oligosperma]KIW37451.1 hypothetical protein PV06_10490 [Exophiala oligosperma]
MRRAPFPYWLRRRRLFFLVALIFCICIFYTLLPILRNHGESNLEAFKDENDSCGRFESTSVYRQNPDHDLERRIDSALLAIQHREESKAQPNLPVKKIWQTWRDPVVPENFDQPAIWRKLHPGWEHQVVSDRDAPPLVSDELQTVPYFEHLFSSSYRPIIRADLLRYTLLWHYGGFYADIDVHPVRSVETCEPMSPLFALDKNMNISLVIGIEVDEPYASVRRRKFWRWDGTHGFIQYAIYAARPFSPILRRAIVRSIAHSVKHEKEKTPWYRLADRFDNAAILEITGPGMFTEAVLDVLTESLPSNHSLKLSQRQKDACPEDASVRSSDEQRGRVTWAPFYRLREPSWIFDEDTMDGNTTQRSGGLGVMPINVWGNGQRHSGSENFHSAQACVNHHFSGTWKQSWLHRTLLKWFHF